MIKIINILKFLMSKIILIFSIHEIKIHLIVFIISMMLLLLSVKNFEIVDHFLLYWILQMRTNILVVL